MLTSKQRAYLRSLASTEPTIMQIGKGGIGENLIKTVSDALEARELIKMAVLENSGEEAREVAEALAEATSAEVVGVVGKKIILYRESEKKKRIEL
ncbi:MAG: ribosome assembly RNA-binding protein YhbY [Clostridia bacterium]|nr:ribosome assembly RNA-binding protein YhbY [Clostridia bacterium]